MTSERTPLLQSGNTGISQEQTRPQRSLSQTLFSQFPPRPNRAHRSDSLASVTSIVSRISAISTYVMQSPIFNLPKTVKRFIAIVLWALFAWGVFQLIFLPRTSLSRDYRRLHFGIVGRAEVERLYLRGFAGEDEDVMGGFYEECLARNYVFGLTDGSELRDYMVNEMREFGHNVETKRYWVNIPEAAKISLELEGRSGDLSEGLESYHQYSSSGEVTSEYVYVHYGTKEDFQNLADSKVTLGNKIHLIRDSNNVEHAFKLAETHGANGIVLFSDPGDEDSYNSTSLPIKSVKYSSAWPGDPTTPTHSCTWSHWCQRELNTTDKTPQIPSLSITYKSAKILLDKLEQGSAELLHLTNLNSPKVKPVDNIMFEIPGLLDEVIIISAPRDAVSLDSTDTASANALLLSLSQHLGHLLTKGWRPLRTIMIVSWDGSKPGMLGSSEYAKDQSKKLSKTLTSYVNLLGVTGSDFNADSNPLLAGYLTRTARKVVYGEGEDDEDTLDQYWNGNLGHLKSYHDYMWFQYILGVPSASLGFGGRSSSTTDMTLIDPGFHKHRVLVKYIGLLSLALSEHETIELDTVRYNEVITSYFHNLTKLHDTKAVESIKAKLQHFKQLATQFDVNNKELQEAMSVDYPWFQAYKKISLAFKIKVMSNVAKRLDSMFLDVGQPLLRHVLWGPDRVHTSMGDVLPGLHEAIRRDDYEALETNLAVLNSKLSLANEHLG